MLLIQATEYVFRTREVSIRRLRKYPAEGQDIGPVCHKCVSMSKKYISESEKALKVGRRVIPLSLFRLCEGRDATTESEFRTRERD